MLIFKELKFFILDKYIFYIIKNTAEKTTNIKN